MYKDITFGKRVLLIILDYLIVGLIAYLVLLGCSGIFFQGVEIPKSVIDWTNSQGSIEALIEIINSDPAVADFINKELQFFGIIVLALFLVHTIYFVLIPLLWKKQTIGRWIMKSRVVKENNQLPQTGTYLMREVVGNTLINLLNCFCGIIPIINLVLILTRYRSIGDIFSGTKIVDLANPVRVNTEDAEFRELNNN